MEKERGKIWRWRKRKRNKKRRREVEGEREGRYGERKKGLGDDKLLTVFD